MHMKAIRTSKPFLAGECLSENLNSKQSLLHLLDMRRTHSNLTLVEMSYDYSFNFSKHARVRRVSFFRNLHI